MSEDHSSHVTNQEDVTAKYKRLLNMARSNLESNQKQLAEKDQQISHLITALEEERAKRITNSRFHREEEGQQFPRRVISRVDVEGIIWILLEYEHIDDEWKGFQNETTLNDFVKRIPGAPLLVPQKCLSVEESSRLMEDTKTKIEKISEEFRKYKVKMEIHLKQREVEQRPISNLSSIANSTSSSFSSSRGASFLNASSSASSTMMLPSTLERALSQGNLTNVNVYQSEVEKLQAQLLEKDAKWRLGYEKLAKELELLKTKGAESVVAAQWRQRYEGCIRDKEDLHARLSLYQQLSSEITEHGQSIEELYVELQEEYKGLRKHLREMLDEYTEKPEVEYWSSAETKRFWEDFLSAVEYYHIDKKDLDDSRLLQPIKLASNLRVSKSNGVTSSSGETFTGGKGMAESKVQYVRQMVFQYLVCREPEVRTHIELALMTLFRFSEEERSAIEAKNQEESQDTLTSITNFLGSFTG